MLSIPNIVLSKKISSYQVGQIFALFQLNCSNFRLEKCKRPWSLKFEGAWSDLESRNGFQKQSVTKY